MSECLVVVYIDTASSLLFFFSFLSFVFMFVYFFFLHGMNSPIANLLVLRVVLLPLSRYFCHSLITLTYFLCLRD